MHVAIQSLAPYDAFEPQLREMACLVMAQANDVHHEFPEVGIHAHEVVGPGCSNIKDYIRSLGCRQKTA